MSQNEEKFYELAHEELEDNPNKGLLVKLGIECDDDKKKIRIRYIETRVEQFKEAESIFCSPWSSSQSCDTIQT